ncbi:adenosylcobinamide-GDP ribazoletransferase [Ruminococcus sp. AM57-5]|nr:adenosylcobinamide-GDP ribazoletransferase [Ruminococcus sp. AM57-5]
MWLLNAMIIAIAMYSKIPMPRVDWNEKNMRYAMCFFPLVGVIIGVLEIVAGNLITVWKGERTFFYAVVLTLIPVFITGGIHLDGFADTMDAKSSYGDREKKLEILKDPHTGAFAIISLCCYFLLCVGIFSEMRTERLFAAALVFVFSRSLSGISVVTFPAAKNSGLLRTFQDGAQKRNARIVLIFWLLAAGIGLYLTAGLCGGAAAVVGLAVFFYYYQFSRKQFGGITGDLAGYFLQLCELFMLAVLALF